MLIESGLSPLRLQRWTAAPGRDELRPAVDDVADTFEPQEAIELLDPSPNASPSSSFSDVSGSGHAEIGRWWVTGRAPSRTKLRKARRWLRELRSALL